MAYTSHGHHIPGTRKGPEKAPMTARCGGVSWCIKCIEEARATPKTEIYKPKHMKEQ